MNAQELATRLVGSSKGITPARMRKAMRFISSRAEWDALLAAITDDDARDEVEAIGEPMVKARYSR
jgi:hypothetical protein